MARFLKSRQMSDGRWAYPEADTRPPLGSWYVGQTALSMRALQLYAPTTDKRAYDEAVQRAAAWLARAETRTTEDRMWRLLGLAWAGTHQDTVRAATRELLSLQRADGGWSDLPSMSSNVYATGRALYALAHGRRARVRPGLSTRRRVPAKHADGGRLLVRPDPRGGIPAVLRRRISARARPMDLHGCDELGDDGADSCGPRGLTADSRESDAVTRCRRS